MLSIFIRIIIRQISLKNRNYFTQKPILILRITCLQNHVVVYTIEYNLAHENVNIYCMLWSLNITLILLSLQ